MEIYFLIALLSLFCGFLSGLLGVGGGILMTPLLLYVPPLFGFPAFSMHLVAGLTIIQALAGSFSGAALHYRFQGVSLPLVLVMGGCIFIAAFVGGASAKWVSSELLMLMFSVLALVASALLLIRKKDQEEHPDPKFISFSRWRAALVALSVGLVGGMVGQAGSFILVPLMIYVVKIPVRIAIGSNLVIVMLSSSAGFIGKLSTGQIEWLLAIPVVLSVVPAAIIGGYCSHLVPVLVLRRMLAFLVSLAACQMWWAFFFVT